MTRGQRRRDQEAAEASDSSQRRTQRERSNSRDLSSDQCEVRRQARADKSMDQVRDEFELLGINILLCPGGGGFSSDE